MDEELARAVKAVKAGIYWRLVGRWCVLTIAAISFLVGVLLLLCRSFAENSYAGELLLGGIVVWLLLLVVGMCCYPKHLPSSQSIIAWLDARSEGGGLMVATTEEGASVWQARRSKISVPFIRWNTWGREMILAVCGVAFLLCAVFAPQIMREANMGKKILNIQDETKKIENQLEILEDNLEVNPEKLKEMKDLLADIQQYNDAGEASKTYEMLDLLQERIDREISEYFNETMEHAISSEKLAEALEKLSQLENHSEEVATASSEIAKFMAKLAEEDKELAALFRQLAETGDLPSLSSLENASSQNPLTPEQQKKLAEFLKKNADKIKEKLKQMAEQMKKNGCSSCENVSMASAEFDLKALEEWLASNGGEECGSAFTIAMQCGGMTGGNGEAGRGRGDAPLEFTNTAKEVEHNVTDLGVDGMAKPDSTSVVKRTLVSPENVGDGDNAVKAGKLAGGNGKVKASSRPIHPQHRKEIENYFKK